MPSMKVESSSLIPHQPEGPMIDYPPQQVGLPLVGNPFCHPSCHQKELLLQCT